MRRFASRALAVSVFVVSLFFQGVSLFAEEEVPSSATVIDFEETYVKDHMILVFPEGVDFFDAWVSHRDKLIPENGFSPRSGDHLLMGMGRFGIYAYFNREVTGEVHSVGGFFSGIGGNLIAFDENGNTVDESSTVCCDFVLNQRLIVESKSHIYLVLFERSIKWSQFSIDDFFFVSEKEVCKSDVPLYLQTDPMWKYEKYGNVWWSERSTRRTIEYEGCAVTSASMVLSHYGAKSTNGFSVNPSMLNSWLRGQPVGYVGGSVNWFSVARYAREVMGVDLWYRGREANDNERLTYRLCSKEPMILELNGHFVVAKGVVNDSFIINDPLGKSSVLSQYYGNWYKSTRRFSDQEKDSRGRVQVGYLIIDSDAESDFHVVSPTGDLFYTSGSESRDIEIDSPVTGKYVVIFDELENIANAKLYIAGGNASNQETLHELDAKSYVEFYYDSASNDSIKIVSQDSRWLYLPLVFGQ